MNSSLRFKNKDLCNEICLNCPNLKKSANSKSSIRIKTTAYCIANIRCPVTAKQTMVTPACFSSMAAAPGLLAPRAPSPTAEENEGKTVANGLTEQKVIKINVSGQSFQHSCYVLRLGNLNGSGPIAFLLSFC